MNGLGLLAILAPVLVAFLASLSEHATTHHQQQKEK